MRIALMMTFVLLLAACGAAQTPTGGTEEDATVGPTVTEQPVTTQAPPTTGVPAATTAPAGTPLAAGSVEAKAAESLAAKFGVDTADLTLVSKEAVEWPDGSLGCPAEGMMYTQAIVPGYKLLYSDGTKTYEVHASQGGEQAIWCENGTPVEPGG